MATPKALTTLTFRLLVALSATTTVSATAPAADVSIKVSLWPGKAPVGDGSYETVTTELKVYLPSPEKAVGAAIVVCPGGGYIRHVMDREGYPIAAWLNAHGIAAVLLEYRLPEGRPWVPLLDAQRAVRMTRLKATEWKVDPEHIGILGFSAGGHVASTAGTHFDAGRADDSDPVERVSCRPDFMLLVYPVVTMGEKTNEPTKAKLLGANPKPELVKLFSNEAQVTDRTPRLSSPTRERHVRAAGEQPRFRCGPQGASRPGGIPRTAFRRPRAERLQGPALGGVEGEVAGMAGVPRLHSAGGAVKAIRCRHREQEQNVVAVFAPHHFKDIAMLTRYRQAWLTRVLFLGLNVLLRSWAESSLCRGSAFH